MQIKAPTVAAGQHADEWIQWPQPHAACCRDKAFRFVGHHMNKDVHDPAGACIIEII
jgi:hypothetical protein